MEGDGNRSSGGGGPSLSTILSLLSTAGGLFGAVKKSPQEEMQPNMGPRPYGGLSIMDLMRAFQQPRRG